jgi:hypothetical protein
MRRQCSGKVTIVRTVSNRELDTVRVTFRYLDKEIEARFDLENFARVVTGQGYIPANITEWTYENKEDPA